MYDRVVFCKVPRTISTDTYISIEAYSAVSVEVLLSFYEEKERKREKERENTARKGSFYLILLEYSSPSLSLYFHIRTCCFYFPNLLFTVLILTTEVNRTIIYVMRGKLKGISRNLRFFVLKYDINLSRGILRIHPAVKPTLSFHDEEIFPVISVQRSPLFQPVSHSHTASPFFSPDFPIHRFPSHFCASYFRKPENR